MYRATMNLVLVFSLVSSVSHGAMLTLDDSDVNTITITWSGFDAGGFTLDGSTFSQAGTATLPDQTGLYLGFFNQFPQAGGTLSVVFAPVGNPTDATSGIFMNYSGGVAQAITGSFGGYNGTPYSQNILGTVPQDGHTESFGIPGLTGTFISEAANAVPEPASLTLAGLGAFGLTISVIRRRRQQQTAV